MSDKYREERIERILKELEYEINRGMMEGEIGEAMSYQFWVPVSKEIKKGVVACEFRTRPVPMNMYSPLDNPDGRRLKIVGTQRRE